VSWFAVRRGTPAAIGDRLRGAAGTALGAGIRAE
jgi:hypothetical protein